MKNNLIPVVVPTIVIREIQLTATHLWTQNALDLIICGLRLEDRRNLTVIGTNWRDTDEKASSERFSDPFQGLDFICFQTR